MGYYAIRDVDHAVIQRAKERARSLGSTLDAELKVLIRRLGCDHSEMRYSIPDDQLVCPCGHREVMP